MLHFTKKIIHKDNQKLWILLILTILVAVCSLPFLPDEIPVHFDAYGNADSFGAKGFIFLAPGFLMFIIISAEFFRHIDPKKENYSLFQNYYYSFLFFVGILLFLLELYTLWHCFIPDKIVNASVFILILLGILFSYIGNALPKFKHNYFVGIRTPHTLSNETVWYMTHRFAGKLWFIGGIFLAFISFLPAPWNMYLFLTFTVLLAALPFLYALWAYKKVTGEGNKPTKNH
ncbi:MAG: DUF1648 domain-containing protein [Lachnospiraceae bacterium]|nr:DUF1648 domain-containing protein [Lachnospiraceae bacterium]